MSARANLRAVLGLDSQQFRAGMRGAGNEAQSFRRQIARVGAAIGVAFSATAIIGLGRSLMRWASDVSLAARNVGVLTSEMIALNRVAQQSGLGVSDLQRMLARMQDELYRAARGSDESARKFRQLGLSVEDLAAMDPASMLQAVARAAMETGTPLAMLSDLFGQRLGPSAIIALREIAENGLPAVGRAIGETADKIEGLSSSWTRTMDEIKGAALSAAAAIVERWQVAIDFWSGMQAHISQAADAEEGFFRRRRAALASLPGAIAAGGDAIKEGEAGRSAEVEESRRKREQEEAARIAEMTRLAEEADAARRASEDAAAQARVDRERDTNEQIRRSRLDGLARMEADHAAAMAAIQNQIEGATGDERRVLEERAAMMRRHYQEDVAAHLVAEADKRRAETASAVAPLVRERDRLRERGQSLQGRAHGVSMDRGGMARIGGFFGGERAGMEVESKQLRVQQESRALLQEIADLNRQIAEAQTRSRGA